MRRRQKLFILKFAVFGALLTGFIFLANRYIPRQHLPWRSLDIHAPTGFATDIQLLRLSLSPSSSCAKVIESARDYHTSLAEKFRPQNPCGWNIARNVNGSDAVMLTPEDVTMQCPLAVGTYIWMNELERAADEHLGSGIESIRHAGAYSCRRQVGNNSGKWSEHAYANAFDILGFELENGSYVSVLKDWDGDKSKRDFLRDARKQACKIFRVTLSPDFNAAHADHFHVDMGPTTSCR
ncbi:MAG: extensin family protein [Hellea sp.]|nr:extensin family protein [Hellea sp.]